MANPYSIHLVEPLSPEVAQRVASETASQLGGTPDKLAQLLTRISGSRIARASSAAQADRVANILRKAGVVVQVVDPEQTESTPSTQVVTQAESSSLPAQVHNIGANVPVVPLTEPLPPQPNASPSNYNVNAGSSSNSSGGTPIVPDEIIPIDEAPYSPPAQAINPPSMPDLFPINTSPVNTSDPFSAQTDPFASGSKDLFSQEPSPFGQAQNPSVAKPSNNPFAPPASDPFAAPTNDPFVTPANDPFAAPASDPFGAAKNNPFTEPVNSDPFAAPKNDPFAIPSARDPFAAAAGMTPNPELAPGFDPFTQNQATGAASDLPAQALKAQNRGTRRTSVRNQILTALVGPILAVGLGLIAFLAYQLPITLTKELGRRALVAAVGAAAGVAPEMQKLPNPEVEANLQKRAQSYLNQFPEAVFVIYGSGPDTPGGEKRVNASRIPITPKDMDDIGGSLDPFENNFGQMQYRGVSYIGSTVKIAGGGDVHVGFLQSSISDEVTATLVPILVALGLALLLAAVVAAALASRLVRPIIAAADQANRISLGDLDRTVDIQSNDEIGDLLGSLERMRVSLKSVIGRLRRDR